MGQATHNEPHKPTALVVEDDALQRASITMLLEESEMNVIQCESGEAAELVLEHVGGCLSTLLTDVNLAGRMDGIELAHIAHEKFPGLRIVVISSKPRVSRLPDGTTFIAKPWSPLDVLRETQRPR